MRLKDAKMRTERRRVGKSEEVVRTYDKVQAKYLIMLEENSDVAKISANVVVDIGEEKAYTSDFVCTKKNGDMFVRECVYRSKLQLPKTCRLLDKSREYWRRRGIGDWAIVVNREGGNEKR